MKQETVSEHTKALRMLDFGFLQKQGIAPSRTQLARMYETVNFPRPIHTGPNSVRWLESEVAEWIEQRKLMRDRCPSEAGA